MLGGKPATSFLYSEIASIDYGGVVEWDSGRIWIYTTLHTVPYIGNEAISGGTEVGEVQLGDTLKYVEWWESKALPESRLLFKLTSACNAAYGMVHAWRAVQK